MLQKQPDQKPAAVVTNPNNWDGSVVRGGNPELGHIHLIHQKAWTPSDEANPDRRDVIVRQQKDLFAFLDSVRPDAVFAGLRTGNGHDLDFLTKTSRIMFPPGASLDALNPLTQQTLFYCGAAFVYCVINRTVQFTPIDSRPDNSSPVRIKSFIDARKGRTVAVILDDATPFDVGSLLKEWTPEISPRVLSHLNPHHLDQPRENVDRLLALRSCLVRDGATLLPVLEQGLNDARTLAQSGSIQLNGELRAFMLAVEGVGTYPTDASPKRRLAFVLDAVDAKIRAITISAECSPVPPGVLVTATAETIAPMLDKVRFPAATTSLATAVDHVDRAIKASTGWLSTARQGALLRVSSARFNRSGPFTDLVGQGEWDSLLDGSAAAMRLGVASTPGQQLMAIRGSRTLTAEMVLGLHMEPALKLEALDRLRFDMRDTFGELGMQQQLLAWGGNSAEFTARVMDLRAKKAGPFSDPQRQSTPAPTIRAKLGVTKLGDDFTE